MSYFINQIGLLTAFLCLFLSIYFLKMHKKNLLLGLSFAGVALEVITCLFQQQFPQVYFISFGNTFFYAPVFYLYVLAVNNDVSRITLLKRRLLFIPWLTDGAYKIYWLLQSNLTRTTYLDSVSARLYIRTFDLLAYISIIFLLSFALVRLRLYQQSGFLKINHWLTQLIRVLLTMHVVWLADDIAGLMMPDNPVSGFMPAVSISAIFLLVCWTGFSALQNTFFVKKKNFRSLLHQKTRNYITSWKPLWKEPKPTCNLTLL